MKIIKDSHLDHGLMAGHLEWILDRFSDRTEMFAESVLIPSRLPSLECALRGPAVGDPPIPDEETVSVVRNGRNGPSRLCKMRPKPTRMLTVIAGPHEGDPCVLFTAYGGPIAPREPWDETGTEADKAESKEFWSQHALCGAPEDD